MNRRIRSASEGDLFGRPDLKNLSNKIHDFPNANPPLVGLPAFNTSESNSSIPYIDDSAKQSQTELRPNARADPETRPNEEINPEVRPNAELNPEVRPNEEINPEVRPNAELNPEVSSNSELNPEVRPNAELNTEVRPNAELNPSIKPKPKPKLKRSVWPDAVVVGTTPKPDSNINDFKEVPNKSGSSSESCSGFNDDFVSLKTITPDHEEEEERNDTWPADSDPDFTKDYGSVINAEQQHPAANNTNADQDGTKSETCPQKSSSEDNASLNGESVRVGFRDASTMTSTEKLNSPVVLVGQYDLTSANHGAATNGKVYDGLDGHLSAPADKNGTVGPPERERHLSTTSEVSRGNWGSKWEFLLSCVGLSVGIGNIWRFPYLAYSNGGGAFLIPYLIMLLLAGKPMYFMELCFGQFAGKGPISVWKCCPIAKGVGAAMIVVCVVICTYYVIIMAYTIFYIASSFQAEVPWMRCDPAWANMTTCFVRNSNSSTNGTNVTMATTTMGPMIAGADANSTDPPIKWETASQQYWERYVLGLTPGVDNVGIIKWDLALCSLFCWIIVVLCLIRGIKTSGKVVYFAATFPYIILIILLITGLTQEGAMDGVLYFITPQWKRLLEISVWKEAAGQMFFSLSVSMGSLIMYSSYNPFRNNVYRDAMIVSVLDTVTSIIAGIVIFSVLGAMAHDLNLDVKDVVKGGPGLAFVAYPEALARLPIPQLWSVLFFLMLFILGLDSQFANFENILTSVSDEIPILRKHKTKFCIGLAAALFLLGLSCVTQGGQYVLNMMDNYGASTSLIFIAIFECIAIMWVYGLRRFCDDVEFMLDTRPSIYLKVTWFIFSPILLLGIFLYTIGTHTRLTYDDYEYPAWADGVGWILALASMILIPGFAIFAIKKQPGPSLLAKIRQSALPDPDWGPADPIDRENWRTYMEEKRTGITQTPMTTYDQKSNKHRANGGMDNPAFNGGTDNPAFAANP